MDLIRSFFAKLTRRDSIGGEPTTPLSKITTRPHSRSLPPPLHVYSPSTSTPSLSPIRKNDKTTVWRLTSSTTEEADKAGDIIEPRSLDLSVDSDLQNTLEESINTDVTKYTIENQHGYILKEGSEYFYVAYNEDGEFDPASADFIFQGSKPLFDIFIDYF